jgi:hypothetical protein
MSDHDKLAVLDAEPAAVTMFERLASDPSVSVEKLERLIAMRERVMAHEAEAAFNVAFAEMQAEIPVIAERGKTDKARYALFEDIIEAIRPILHTHGFSLSHQTEWPDKGTVRVIGILTHLGGHARRTEFLSDADTGPGRNSIQSLGSALSYGRRYTTYDLLNITSRYQDDDGQKAGAAKKPERAVPAGFDDWLLDLEATSETGTAALQDMWTKSANECRRHLMATDKPKWDALKKRAEKAS